MTKERIARLRAVASVPPASFWEDRILECLDEIERLQRVEKDAAKAIVKLNKGRK